VAPAVWIITGGISQNDSRIASKVVFLSLAVMACTSFSSHPVPEKTNTAAERERVMIYVIVKVPIYIGCSLCQRSPHTAESSELLSIIEALGVTLEPMHPGVTDPNLMEYFTVKVSSTEAAQRVINHLRQSKAIEAAYIKPADELP